MSVSKYRSRFALAVRSRRFQILVMLMLLGAALRFLPLSREAISGDEMFSRRVALEPFSAAWQHIQADLVHPPLYYLLLRFSMGVWGSSVLGMRFFSLLCGLLTLPLLALLGARLPGGRWCGVLAAASVAVSRYPLYYSQEARSYAFYSVLVLLMLLWFERIVRHPEDRGLWLAGAVLMTALVYTHYVGGLFLFLLLVAAVISRVPVSVRLRVIACGIFAFLAFLPWLYTEALVYRNKHGVGDNLDWQGHPSFYDVRMVWAASLGVGNFRGGTVLALCLAVVLSLTACLLLSRTSGLRRSPVLVALALMGWLTPVLLFVLSSPPVNLPLFNLRHLLPSTYALLLLCCYGLELLARKLERRSLLVRNSGAVAIFLLAAVPTVGLLLSGPTRYPYDQVEREVVSAESGGTQAYAAWYYGEGEPVNLYCGRRCVEDLPGRLETLPEHIVLLYRPASSSERRIYNGLTAMGFVNKQQSYFTDGQATAYGTVVVQLDRQNLPPLQPQPSLLSLR